MLALKSIVLLGFVVLVNSAAQYGGVRQRISSSTPLARAPYSSNTKVVEETSDVDYNEPAAAIVEDLKPNFRQSSYVKQSNDDYSRSPSVSSSSYGSSAQYKIDNERMAEEQAKSAKYAFASAVDDGIMDQSQVRQEVRDGLKVSGSYSYSDGFFKRTVKYEADENGYRVVGEEIEPIGDGAGPQVDLVNGKADVHTQVEGVDTQYSISAYDINTMGGRATTTSLDTKKQPSSSY